MVRRDWWLAVLILALALLVHAAVPRYELVSSGMGGVAFIRFDRWTGRAEVVPNNMTRVPWVYARQ